MPPGRGATCEEGGHARAAVRAPASRLLEGGVHERLVEVDDERRPLRAPGREGGEERPCVRAPRHTLRLSKVMSEVNPVQHQKHLFDQLSDQSANCALERGFRQRRRTTTDYLNNERSTTSVGRCAPPAGRAGRIASPHAFTRCIQRFISAEGLTRSDTLLKMWRVVGLG